MRREPRRGRAITIISLTRVRPFVSDAVFQTIFLYASIVTEIQYPEPAKTLNDMLSIFTLQVFNMIPPECADPDATFYTKLVIMTSVPLIVPLLIWLYMTFIRRDPDANPKAFVTSIQFLELILGAVTLVSFQTFACEEFDDGHRYLVAQLNLRCDGPTILPGMVIL